MSFAPGDEVVCVAERAWNDKRLVAWPVRDGHYIVRAVQSFDKGDGLLLNEIVNPALSYLQGVAEPTFHVRNFRPVKRESIELFRAMCTSTKPLVEV